MLGCGCSVCPQAGRHRHRLSGRQRQRRGEERSARRDRPVHSAHRVVCARLLLPHDAWQPLPRRRKCRVRGSNSFRLIPGANPRPSSPPIPSLGARCTPRALHSLLIAPTSAVVSAHLVRRAPRAMLESVGDRGLHPHLLIELRALVCGAWTAAAGGRIAGPRRVLAARALVCAVPAVRPPSACQGRDCVGV